MGLLPPLDIVARIALLPVLVWQGLRVRRRALVLPEASGPRTGTSGQGQALRLLILGDSSAAGVGVDDQSQALLGQTVKHLEPHFEVSWRLLAKTGATSKSALTKLKTEPRVQYDVAVLALGVNDAVRLLPLRVWRQQQAELRRVLRSEFAVQRLIVTAVPPIAEFPALPKVLQWILGAHAARMDMRLEQDLLSEPSATYLTFDLPFTTEFMARDGYHPNARFNALWGQVAAQHIVRAHG